MRKQKCKTDQAGQFVTRSEFNELETKFAWAVSQISGCLKTAVCTNEHVISLRKDMNKFLGIKIDEHCPGPILQLVDPKK